MTTPKVAQPDTRHAGAQKVYFVCFTEPAGTSLDDIRPHVPAHKEWIAEQERAGRLLVAGPFLDEEFAYSGSGMLVIRAATAEEATKIMAADPMHTSGMRTFRIVPWQLNEGSIDVRMTLSSGTYDFD